MKLQPDDLVTLETMIDRTSLAAVLRALRDVCDEKAAHVSSGYVAHGEPDNALAAQWTRAGIQVGNTAERSAVAAVS